MYRTNFCITHRVALRKSDNRYLDIKSAETSVRITIDVDVLDYADQS